MNKLALVEPYTTKGIQSLESVKKFACKVCLKQWNMNYESIARTVGPYTFITTPKAFKINYNV